MRVVANTNIIISGLFWHGAPRQILDAARSERIELYTSAPLLAELDDVLRRRKFAGPLGLIDRNAEEIVAGFAALARVVKPRSVTPVVIDDPDDDAVLECAIAARADVIVSGDSHLLRLENFGSIPILTARELLESIS